MRGRNRNGNNRTANLWENFRRIDNQLDNIKADIAMLRAEYERIGEMLYLISIGSSIYGAQSGRAAADLDLYNEGLRTDVEVFENIYGLSLEHVDSLVAFRNLFVLSVIDHMATIQYYTRNEPSNALVSEHQNLLDLVKARLEDAADRSCDRPEIHRACRRYWAVVSAEQEDD
ncbi:hypothetical protein BDV28DRAFT_148849 [Aspergillus coremiiformis]|uniref:Uncharacterized protein n=1 Tax=Aspergillus coremiiformis TaxID=138285 RepID=A0A5N6Z7E4_9EURO|nr:hypothetical protein BDV28DRAFT_148849 [Aspergillus coremiiformis]